MIEGINHITFAVCNLEISFRFYTEVLGFRPLARWNKGAYLVAGESWICLATGIESQSVKVDEYTHTAFSVCEKNFQPMADRILRAGAEQWQENRSEGKSLYFLDPDGHKLEIHTGDWQTRLEACRKKPFTGMKFFD